MYLYKMFLSYASSMTSSNYTHCPCIIFLTMSCFHFRYLYNGKINLFNMFYLRFTFLKLVLLYINLPRYRTSGPFYSLSKNINKILMNKQTNKSSEYSSTGSLKCKQTNEITTKYLKRHGEKPRRP